MLIMNQRRDTLLNTDTVERITVERCAEERDGKFFNAVVKEDGDLWGIVLWYPKTEEYCVAGMYSIEAQANKVFRRIMWNQGSGYLMPKDGENWEE